MRYEREYFEGNIIAPESGHTFVYTSVSACWHMPKIWEEWKNEWHTLGLFNIRLIQTLASKMYEAFFVSLLSHVIRSYQNQVLFTIESFSWFSIVLLHVLVISDNSVSLSLSFHWSTFVEELTLWVCRSPSLLCLRSSTMWSAMNLVKAGCQGRPRNYY